MSRSKLVVADNLEDARPDEVVYLNRKGAVRSRMGTWLRAGALLGLVGLEIVLLGYLIGLTAAIPFALLFTAIFGWRMRPVLASRRALASYAADAFAEAEDRFEALTEMRFVGKRVRATGFGGLAACALMRGERDEALRLKEQQIALIGNKRDALAQIARNGHIRLLALSGQLEEAKRKFAELGPIPKQDYVRMEWASTELLIGFLEGHHALSDETLHERATEALKITSASALLTLLAWAFDQNGDGDMRDLLLAEARDRDLSRRFELGWPEVHAWMMEGSAPKLSARVELSEEEDAALAELEESLGASAERSGRR